MRTGSWRTRATQGKGLGAKTRTAGCCSVFADNPSSLGINRRLGYRPNGSKMLMRRPGEAAENLQFFLTPADLLRPDWQLRVDGVTAEALEMLGAASPAPQ